MPKSRPKPTGSAAELIPDRPTLDTVRAASKDCRACELWRRGTQTVFGEGGRRARLMFVGEQPGNDLATVHPSSILRAPDDETRHAEMTAFADDLRKVANALK